MNGNSQQPELQGVSIVVVGSFNPAIFQPHWLSSKGLIREDEASESRVEIIHKDIAIFSTNWFGLQVTDDKFVLDSKDPTKYLPIRDLACGIFQILEHTPIRAFGFNCNLHFRMPSEEEWHAFGDYFAPKESWSPILTNPGMKSLTMEGTREGCDADRIWVKVEPSGKTRPGVFIRYQRALCL